MGERAAYSRVYWEIVDDPKFVAVYDDDHHLAAWMRLLLIADQAHPASAHLPTNVRRASVKALADAELVDLLPGSRYRIHGLDAERQRRKDYATSRPPTGPGRGPNGSQSGTGRAPLAPESRGLSLDERETSQAEGDARATDDRWDAPETEALQWLAKHGCYVRPGDGYHQKLVVAVERLGVNAIVGWMGRLAEAGVANGDVKGLLFGAIDAADKAVRPNLSVVEKEDRDEERSETFARRALATKLRAHANGAHTEPNPGCPACKEQSA